MVICSPLTQAFEKRISCSGTGRSCLRTDFGIDGTPYEYVIRFVPDTATLDASMPARTIYFSFRNGILKYENKDAEVFEFLMAR